MVKKVITTLATQKLRRADLYEMIKETGLIYIVDGKTLFGDENGTWPAVSEMEAKLCIRSLFEDKEWQSFLDDGIVGNLIKSLKTDPDLQRKAEDFKNPSYVKVSNGIWDVQNQKITEVENQMFNRALDVALTEELPEESEVFQRFCSKVFTKESLDDKKQALYEIIGYSISDISPVKMAIFLIGPSNCGKSVILKLIQKLIGEQHVSNVPLSAFSKDFNVSEMYDKAINISGEVPSGALPSRALDVFKGITGLDRLQLNKKFGQPVSVMFDTKLLFAGNTLPIFNKVDGTDSLIERLHLLIFDNEVPKDERDNLLMEKLWEERDAIVRYSLKAVKEFEDRQCRFLMLEDEKKMLNGLRHVANPIKHFMETKACKGEDKVVHVSDAYEAYKKFAAAEALPDLDRTTFRTLVSMQPGVSIDKTKRRLGKRSPQVCFSGFELKSDYNLSDTTQDTDM